MHTRSLAEHMERLLAHPASLPLVHVDHSHRAPAVRTTGECYKVVNSNPVEASFYVIVQGEKDLKLRNTRHYFLQELDCSNHNKPKVSLAEAERVQRLVQEMANYSGFFSTSEMLDVQMVNEHRYGDGFIMRLKHDYRTNQAQLLYYLDGSQDGIRADATEAKNRLQTFLTDNYDKPDEPLFRLWHTPAGTRSSDAY